MKKMTLGQALVQAAETGEYTVETLAQAEARAFQDFSEVMHAAFKADGFRGVVATAGNLAEMAKKEADKSATAGESEEDCRSSFACYVDQVWAPGNLRSIAEQK